MSETKAIFHIFLDTNIIYTRSINAFLAPAVQAARDMTASYRKAIELQFFLPEVVAMERFRQMHTELCKLIPVAKKIALITKEAIDLTEHTVSRHIEAIQARQLRQVGVGIKTPASHKIEWHRIVSGSIWGTPPFVTKWEDGELSRETGFQDALAMETFFQHAAENRKIKRCVFAFVTKDARLREAMTERALHMPRVRILSNLNEAVQLITSAAENIDEILLASIADNAARIFDSDSPEWKSKPIWPTILERFPEVLQKDAEDWRVTYDTQTSKPYLEKRAGNKFHWFTWYSVYNRREFIRYAPVRLDLSDLPPDAASVGVAAADIGRAKAKAELEVHTRPIVQSAVDTFNFGIRWICTVDADDNVTDASILEISLARKEQ